MKCRIYILFLTTALFFSHGLHAQDLCQGVSFDFYSDVIEFPIAGADTVAFGDTLSPGAVRSFYENIETTNYRAIVKAITDYKQRRQPDDWIYYQLIRKTAQAIAPKEAGYNSYTLYKWFLLCKSGYDASLCIIGKRLLIYVQSDDEIYDIPTYYLDGKKYICLNYHDYGYKIDFEKEPLSKVPVTIAGATNKFSYKLTKLPEFNPESYHDKQLQFTYKNADYRLNVKVNDEVKKMFTNYPVVDYQLYFDAPLSSETYSSLITQLRSNMKRMSVKKGVDYLMHFTRYAFAYQPDSVSFGREKYLSPEQTLLYDHSDCEDRAALFYCLVKEIYNLPMLVIAFPHHVTIAIKFDKPVGTPIVFNGATYSICEPTLQAEDLPMGDLSSKLKTTPYQVVYAYTPKEK